MSAVLSDKDVNAPVVVPDAAKPETKNYHQHLLQARAEIAKESQQQQYVSPSDNIMSPCTAKLHALRSKHVGKVKPKSLFARASAKKLEAQVNATGGFPGAKAG